MLKYNLALIVIVAA